MLKVLALGNSFSQNATTYLDKMFDGIFVRNLYIGGCPLDLHSVNLKNNSVAYEYQKNGVKVGDLVSANDIMKGENWDIVTVQQASRISGMYDTYYPYLTEVLNYIKEFCPKAKIVFHQTWAYATYSDLPFFNDYDRDQTKMHNAIISASNKVAKENNLGLIECGKAIATLREKNPIDSQYSCDGFHLNSMGCFCIGAVWGKYFGLKYNGFIPQELDEKEAKKNLEILGVI